MQVMWVLTTFHQQLSAKESRPSHVSGSLETEILAIQEMQRNCRSFFSLFHMKMHARIAEEI